MNERAIFEAALERKDPQQRTAYLNEVCGADPALRQHIEGLLRAHEMLGSFMTPPAPAPDATTNGPVTERLGTVIGPYKLLQQIGEGGMGTVFMAEQTQPVQRKVALKLIKSGMDSRQVIARFEAERQALALMDHPNIARVLDAGATDSGRPYFVMELVKGMPITTYCDEHQLTCKERLELFVPVCQAVQHSHQKGIIHRDLKPSNVMVCLYDGRPVPKVIDFGVVKAAGPRLTDKTLFTELGQVVGTLEYMSPEQAELNQLDVDTRSDVYSLGVLLYELLTGTTPLERGRVQGTAFLEVLRLIREEEPPRPSTRLSTAEGLPAIAVNRGLEPRKLSGLLRGELDWIVMKALEKDRNRRYETANSLAQDVQRYLCDEPVLACPPSATYRFRKFARRNKAALVMATLVSAALVVTLAVLAISTVRITRERNQKEDALHQARANEEAVTDQLDLTRKAERLARRRLYHSLVGQARASRFSQRVGQRFDGLKALEEAARIAREMELPEKDMLELRNEAIACLALPDLRVAREWDGWPAGTFGAAFDHKLARYARVDRQGAVSIRRVADDTEICPLPSPGPGEVGLLLSPDGRFLGLWHGAGHMQLWDLAAVKPVKLLDEVSHAGLDFSPDSRRLVLGNMDGSITVHELPSCRRLRRLAPGPRPYILAFGPRGRKVAVAYHTGVQVRDLETGTVLKDFPHPFERWPWACWHPDGSILATVGGDGIIRLWDVASGKETNRLEGIKNKGIHFTFNHAGNLLASTGWEGRLRLWDSRTGKQLLSTPSATCSRLRFSPDDRLLCGDVKGTKIRFWELTVNREYRTLVRDPVLGKGFYEYVSVSADGRLLAVGMQDGFGLWDLAGGKPLAFVRQRWTPGILFEPSGTLLTFGDDGLRRWPIGEGPGAPGALRIGPPQILFPTGAPSRVSRSRDGRVLAVGIWGGSACVLHAGRLDKPLRLVNGGQIGYPVVSPDGRFVATWSHHGVGIKIWEAGTGKLVRVLLPKQGVGQVCFSPNGRRLAAVSAGDCRLWSVPSWKEGLRIGAGSKAGPFAFSPDGKLLALPTGEGAIRLVDADTGRKYARLEDPNQDRASGVNFSPDNTLLFVNTGDGQAVHVWDLRALREQLDRIRLDWHRAAYAPSRPSKWQGPLSANVDLGALAPEGPQKTIVTYSLVVSFMPLHAEAYLRRGRAYYQLGQWHKAADDLGVALALNPGTNDFQVWFELGYACGASGRLEQAIAAYSRAIKLNPKCLAAWNNRGLQHESRGQLEKAVTDFAKALELNPRYDVALSNRSRVEARLGLWEKTVDDCSRLLDLGPGPRQIEGYYRRAGAYGQLGRYPEARADYQKLLELAPNSPLVHNDLSWLLANCADAKLRDPARAVQLAQRAIELSEPVGNTWNTLGVAYYRAGNWKAARAALEKSMELRKGGDSFDWFFLAMTRWRLGDKIDARQWYDQAVRWMEKNQPHNEELVRFRGGAKKLLELKK